MLSIKICLCFKDPNEENYQYLINKRENIGFKELKDPKTLIEYFKNTHNG